MSLNKYRQHGGKFDYWILFLVFGLCFLGILMIYSSSAVLSFEQYGTNDYYFKKQLMSLGIGFVGLIVASFIDYRFWKKYSVIFLMLTLVLLFLVFVFGDPTKGAQRWLQLGSINIQPSEIIKLSFIIYLAAWLEKRKDQVSDFKHGFIPFVVILSVIGFLIIKQPDMGTMSVIVMIAVAMFFVSGASLLHLSLGVATLLGIFAILIKSAPYRLQRFLVFLNPADEKLGAGYHINQALLAVGSGGLWGLGFGQSKQKYLYLPEPHTDSIFAIISEELGFLRSVLILIVFLIIILRCFKVAKNAPDQFSSLLVTGITVWILVQFLVNIGAMLGVLPLTGIPLPFVSYGGSSLIMLMVAIGIVLNISKQSKTNN